MKRDFLFGVLLLILAVTGYYFYQERHAAKVIVSMENSLEAICNQAEQSFSDLEEDFEI